MLGSLLSDRYIIVLSLNSMGLRWDQPEALLLDGNDAPSAGPLLELSLAFLTDWFKASLSSEISWFKEFLCNGVEIVCACGTLMGLI